MILKQKFYNEFKINNLKGGKHFSKSNIYTDKASLSHMIKQIYEK